ncbi:MAG: methionine--tRNA ligase [Candidatus Rokubacteria bacterium]|nr:methionine--tRNA ligase [Candidatus Rokubacteria bacterium]
MSTVYLTTPIYYVNARPHLGHAYTTVLADTMARWHRLRGDDTRLLTGTDEHGDKIAQAAAKANVTPKAYADEIAEAFRAAWQRLGISNDDFIRTTEVRHATVVQQLLQRLYDKDEIYLGRYGGHYCYGCERFYTEKEIVDGTCPDHQTELTWIEEENYFFRMSKYQEWLIALIKDNPGLIQPERYRNEILGFLRDPLQDLSISRPRTRLQWGIPLPFDEKYVTYVWFDALINYISALGELDSERTRRYWPHVQHVIGKDILKPHAIYWPCMLKAAELPVYRRLNVHGYWNIGGAKMSKSVGNVVEAFALSEKYGNDAFRYFVMREMVFGLDADFTEEAFVGRLNADLANDLGNLVSRATTLLVNLAGGKVPAASPGAPTVKEAFERARADASRAMEDFAFSRALAAIWEFIGAVNRYVDTTQPWALAKQPDKKPDLEHALSTLAESLRLLGIVLTPFLPDAAAKIRAGLGQTGTPSLADAEWGRLAAGTAVTKVSGLFPRVDDKEKRVDDTNKAATAKPVGADSPRISVQDFGKIELRVAEVVAADAVPKSKKLLKLTVSLGTEQRTVVAGIAEHYAPADLVGKKVVVVANLEAAKLMGIESNGMVLAGSVDGGPLAVLTLDRDLPPGARVR